MQLRPYQQEALQAIDNAKNKGVRRQLVVIPTGGGKTVVFAELPKKYGRTLVLAHREELLHQAKEKIEWANPELEVAIEQGQNYAGRADIVVASVPTLGRQDSKRLEAYERDYFECVVIDEAHHAAAPSYGRILDHFGDALRIGVTATPQRGDRTRLTDVFDEIVYFKSISDLITEGYLSGLVGYRIPTDVSLDGITVRNGDYAEAELAAAVNIEPRNKLILESYQRLAKDKKCVVFCADVAHADAVAAVFNTAGIPAASILGTTDRELRAQILADFKSGRIKVLTNCMVLTEGFDEPSIEAIITARPTKSDLLFTQIVGRGTRLFPGKPHCLVIDMADMTVGRKPTGLPTLMGLPPDFDCEGEDLLEVKQKYDALASKLPNEVARVRSVKDIADAWERIDLFMPPPINEALLEYTSFVWMETGQEHYILNLGIDDKENRENLRIEGNALGQYEVYFRRAGGEHLLGVCNSMEEAFQRSDKWVKANRADRMGLLSATAQWRKDSPTDKQIKYLRKFGVPIVSDLTKGQASLILDELFKKHPKPERKVPVWVKRK